MIPAGWYDDRRGRVRYWNGWEWTDWVHIEPVRQAGVRGHAAWLWVKWTVLLPVGIAIEAIRLFGALGHRRCR